MEWKTRRDKRIAKNWGTISKIYQKPDWNTKKRMEQKGYLRNNSSQFYKTNDKYQTTNPRS